MKRKEKLDCNEFFSSFFIKEKQNQNFLNSYSNFIISKKLKETKFEQQQHKDENKL